MHTLSDRVIPPPGIHLPDIPTEIRQRDAEGRMDPGQPCLLWCLQNQKRFLPVAAQVTRRRGALLHFRSRGRGWGWGGASASLPATWGWRSASLPVTGGFCFTFGHLGGGSASLLVTWRGLWFTSGHLVGLCFTSGHLGGLCFTSGHLDGGLSLGPDTHHKPTVDLLQNLLLIQGHGLPFPLFDPLLLQAFAGVHFTRGPNLAGTDLRGQREDKGTQQVSSEAPSRPGWGVSTAGNHGGQSQLCPGLWLSQPQDSARPGQDLGLVPSQVNPSPWRRRSSNLYQFRWWPRPKELFLSRGTTRFSLSHASNQMQPLITGDSEAPAAGRRGLFREAGKSWETPGNSDCII